MTCRIEVLCRWTGVKLFSVTRVGTTFCHDPWAVNPCTEDRLFIQSWRRKRTQSPEKFQRWDALCLKCHHTDPPVAHVGRCWTARIWRVYDQIPGMKTWTTRGREVTERIPPGFSSSPVGTSTHSHTHTHTCVWSPARFISSESSRKLELLLVFISDRFGCDARWIHLSLK